MMNYEFMWNYLKKEIKRALEVDQNEYEENQEGVIIALESIWDAMVELEVANVRKNCKS